MQVTNKKIQDYYISLANKNKFNFKKDPLYNKYFFTDIVALENYIIYSENTTEQKEKTIFIIIFVALCNPLLLYNIFGIVLWCMIDYVFYALIILFLSLYSLFNDIVVEYKRNKGIREIANRRRKVFCYRNNKWVKIDTKYLFPGDVFYVEKGKDFPCDAKILKGEAIVDESFLTGETLPVFKNDESLGIIYAGTEVLKSLGGFIDLSKIEKDENKVKVKNISKREVKKRQRDFFEGKNLDQKQDEINNFIEDDNQESKIENKLSETTDSISKKINEEKTSNFQENAIAIVLTTRYNTAKGKLIKNILIPKPINFIFQAESMRFIFFTFLISLMLITLIFVYFISQKIIFKDSFCYSLDLLFCILSPALPATIWIGSSISATRLKNKKIICNQNNRINIAGKVDIVVFDKTGTLTEEGLDVNNIQDSEYEYCNINNVNNLIREGLSSCHSVYKLDNELLGDPLDVKMFLFSESSIKNENGERLIIIGEKEKCEGPVLKEIKEDEEMIYHYKSKETEKGDCIIDFAKKEESFSDIKNFKENFEEPDKNIFYNEEQKKNKKKLFNILKIIKVLKIHEFNNKLRRMSVVIKDSNGDKKVFVKGSPESILSLLKEIPEEYEEDVKDYALDGYRVIALAYKNLSKKSKFSNEKNISNESENQNCIEDSNREELEKNLTFLCFIVFANKLKKETKASLEELNKANIKTIMATGDNILTAISVAKQARLIDKFIPVLFPVIEENAKSIYDANWHCIGDDDLHFDKIKLSIYKNKDRISFDEFCIACEGKEYEYIRNMNKEYFNFLLKKGVVFARMNSDQKKMLVEDLAEKGYTTCFCGDGANDCGALKSADIGIALADNEASIASSFTSIIKNISSVLIVLKEGRCALVTSLSNFQFIVLSSFIQCFCLYILSILFLFLSDLQTIHNDILIVLPFAYIMTEFRPNDELCSVHPEPRLFNYRNIFHVGGHFLIDCFFVGLAIFIAKLKTGAITEKLFAKCTLIGTYTFFVSAFQIIFFVYIFTKGLPHREAKTKNLLFSIFFFLVVVYNLFIFSNLFFNFNKWINLQYENYFLETQDFLKLFAIILINFLVSCIFEQMSKKNIKLFNEKSCDTQNEDSD
ncbi:hypothetical protein GVAV_002474 [Gurleya vavrai]